MQDPCKIEAILRLSLASKAVANVSVTVEVFPLIFIAIIIAMSLKTIVHANFRS